MRHAVVASVVAALLAVTGPALAEDAAPPASGSAIMASGAKCDGTTDDTAAINRFLGGFKAGGLVLIPAGRMCLIDSGDLVVPDNVIIAGEAAAWQRRSHRTMGSGFLLNPAYTIAMHQNAALRNIAVLRAGLVHNPTNAQAIEAVEAWGKEASNGITLDGGGVRLEHLFIEGFNTAIYGFGWGTFIISDVMGDDYNGLFITGAGDNMAILDTRFEPFYAITSPNAHVGAQLHPAGAQNAGAHLRFPPDSLKNVQAGDYAAILSGPHVGALPQGARVVSVDPKSSEVELSEAPTATLDPDDVINFGGSWARPGVAFYLQGNGGNTTGWYCQRCFSFMYRHGAVIDGTGVGTMSEADFEYQNAFDPGTDGTGTFGIRVAGGSAGVSITQSSMSGQSIPFINDMAPPHVLQLSNMAFGYPDFIITAGVPGPKATAGAWFSGRTGEPVIVTLAGVAAAGSEQEGLSVNGQLVTHTARRGGPPGRILSAWGRAINSDPVLVAQHVVAYWSGDSLSIFAPPSVTLTVAPRVSGSVTASLNKGQSRPGSWGSVNGFTYNGPARFPAVVVRSA